MHQEGNDSGSLRIKRLNGLYHGPLLLFELLNPIYQHGDLTCQLDELGVGAVAAAAVRDRRSRRGDLALACALFGLPGLHPIPFLDIGFFVAIFLFRLFGIGLYGFWK